VLTGDGTLKLCGVGEPRWLAEDAPDEPTPASDLHALGRLAQEWLASVPRPKLARAKSAKPLFELVDRLAGPAEAGYASATALLEDLERIGDEVPPNGEAWDRLLRIVRQCEQDALGLRHSA